MTMDGTTRQAVSVTELHRRRWRVCGFKIRECRTKEDGDQAVKSSMPACSTRAGNGGSHHEPQLRLFVGFVRKVLQGLNSQA